jgi:hypothetical protein
MINFTQNDPLTDADLGRLTSTYAVR